MSAQKRETRKNFIAILSETAEEQHMAERQVKPDRPLRRGFLGLMAAALNRNVGATRLSE